MSIEPLPSTGVSKMLGLCELLDDRGGREDVYVVAQDLHLPFGELLLAAKGAEMLGLVETPPGTLALTALGKELLGAALAEKKRLMKQQMLKLRVFQHVIKLIENSDKKQLPAEILVEDLAVRLPQEQPRQLLTTLLNWGRYGDVFGYSRDTDKFDLP